MAVKIPVPQDKISDFCKRHSIRKQSLFGSVLRDDLQPDSDIDVLIEFEPGCTPGLGIVDIKEELYHLLGHRRVDLAELENDKKVADDIQPEAWICCLRTAFPISIHAIKLSGRNNA